ncbi:Uncharacterised protein [Mycobacteroides abscessus subsp. abscessus]|uniref:hypothetical protein n=1 Tax=Mycobacteroides abscessus TaxID=36809 RepID=UPI0009260D9B|nr:hypothetical protein [Mycobacteroides abscessus]SIJ48664.1 Uncharacterised protein [Mycobacteroides abscessus subsp. abscessus]SIM01326.1 Uncharacterised protein [Mycobacteroides abscessus subsp. abscessus]SLL04178.1 Uncharacterised protein [Mycobacteroides abscessus subsp. abscessus]
MNLDDFFAASTEPDAWGSSTTELRIDLLRQLRAGAVPGLDDLDVAIALAGLVWDELKAYGTDGATRLNDEQIAVAQRALKATLRRVNIELDLPWRDFESFKTHWIRNDCSGSWQARRVLLEEFFGPVQQQLDRLEEAQFRAVNAEAVSPHTKTGWPKVDTELTELRRRFRTAATTQDYRDTGNRAVAVLEAVSRAVYDPAVHVREGETELSPDKTKLRISRYVEDSLAGKDNEAIRGVVVKTIELAHSVKHSTEPTRREAGIAADAVIMLANILRRVDQDF